MKDENDQQPRRSNEGDADTSDKKAKVPSRPPSLEGNSHRIISLATDFLG